MTTVDFGVSLFERDIDELPAALRDDIVRNLSNSICTGKAERDSSIVEGHCIDEATVTPGIGQV